MCEKLSREEILKENMSDVFLETRQVETQWKHRPDTQERIIKKVNKFDQENY